MEHTWRWYGPRDPITLADIGQTGATGIVSALHDLPPGTAWPRAAIAAHCETIEAAGLRWSVVESVPVAEAIKTGDDTHGARETAIAAWCETLEQLAVCGIRTVCYNFMPVLDWTRTDLAAPLATGGHALRFDFVALAAFDLFVLRRPGAEADYAAADIRAAEAHAKTLDRAACERLGEHILAGLPGSAAHYDQAGFLAALAAYRSIDETRLRDHLTCFLRAVVPVAERLGIRLAIHPDDPPRPLFALPRVVSTAADLRAVVDAAPSPANGVTLCTGSLGAREDNDVVSIARELAPHIHFAHLRATRRDANEPRSFVEAAHLEGDIDMVGVVAALLAAEDERIAAGGQPIPMRPDHGHALLDDLRRETRPGYPLIGRLRGLAELRGVERALRWRSG